jgi:hypothetical protein
MWHTNHPIDPQRKRGAINRRAGTVTVTDLERLLSRFASPKSDEARLEALSDPSHLSGFDENDPQSMARMMKKMGEEMGEDLGDDVDGAMEGGQDAPPAIDQTDLE